MIFADPIPAEMRSGEFYREAAAYYLSEEKLQSDYASVRFERELRLFHRYCSRGSVLDVGCSSGAFLFQLNGLWPNSYDVTGTDVSTCSLRYAASKGIRIVEADFLHEEFAGKRFDAITLWAVLEHLAEPKLFIDKAAKLLKEDGLLFVLVPNVQSLAFRLLGARYRYVLAEHVNYFSEHQLRFMVSSQFEVIGAHFTHFNPFVILKDWRRGEAEVPQRERAALLKRTNAMKASPLLLPLKMMYRGVEGALGLLKLTDNFLMVLRKRKTR